MSNSQKRMVVVSRRFTNNSFNRASQSLRNRLNTSRFQTDLQKLCVKRPDGLHRQSSSTRKSDIVIPVTSCGK